MVNKDIDIRVRLLNTHSFNVLLHSPMLRTFVDHLLKEIDDSETVTAVQVDLTLIKENESCNQ
jgi:hypothetical protein